MAQQQQAEAQQQQAEARQRQAEARQQQAEARLRLEAVLPSTRADLTREHQTLAVQTQALLMRVAQIQALPMRAVQIRERLMQADLTPELMRALAFLTLASTTEFISPLFKTEACRPFRFSA